MSLANPRLQPRISYDVSVKLSGPPASYQKTQRGNFMVNLRLLGSQSMEDMAVETIGNLPVLQRVSRTALWTVHSELVTLIQSILFLPFYVLSTRPELHTIIIPMSSNFQFDGVTSVPIAAHVELVECQEIQTYYAALEFTAGRQIVRHFLAYLYLPTILLLTSTFWIVELALAGIAWLVVNKLATKITARSRRQHTAVEKAAHVH